MNFSSLLSVLFPLCLLLSAPFVTAEEPRTGTPVAFDRNDGIYLFNPSDKKTQKIADGIFPSVSPDGTRVAYTSVEKNGTSYIRHIAVVTLADGKSVTFKDVPSDNVYYPTWSPDGQWIAFTLRRDQVWDLVRIKADGTGFATVKKGLENEVTLYSPCWARDGQSLFCQDMTNLYRISLDGTVAEKWKISEIVPNGDMSGDGRVSVSPDGSRLLLSIDMGEETQRKDWDGPPPALWIFDLKTAKATRLTPKKLFAWDGCWLSNDNVVFNSRGVGEKDPALYRMSLRDKTPIRLVGNAQFPATP